MTPQKQLIQHDPANGKWGDCYRTCIACLLDMPASDVPHFNDGCDTNAKNLAADAACRNWLKERGYNIIKVGMFAEHAGVAAEWFDDVPYILTGQSPNTEGVPHCVIGKGAFEVIWDVSPSGKGLAGPNTDEIGNRVYWIEFIVPVK